MDFLASLVSLYRINFASKVISLLEANDYRLYKFLASFWTVNNYHGTPIQPDAARYHLRNLFLRSVVLIGSLIQLIFGAILLGYGASGRIDGGIYFGVALMISYPVVWAHLVLVAVLVFRAGHLPKTIGKYIVLSILSRQVRQLRAKHDFKIIAVAGSTGKTSTKFALAQTLESKLKVRWQQGNYNDIVSVPLVFFNQEMPGVMNVATWLKIIFENRKTIRNNYDVDVVVLELGTDSPGQIEKFSKYLKVDIGIITAVTPEHMEFFGTLDAVADEELALASYSDKLLVNSDLVANEYLAGLADRQTYGFEKADWRLADVKFRNKKHSFKLMSGKKELVKASVNFLSRNQLYGLAAASAVASELGFAGAEIKKAITKLEPVAGRLKSLVGIKNSTILDDTYNSAPEAALAALDTLYKIKAPQKIAVLGSMNELGNYSEESHQRIGEYCDPKNIDLLVTIGETARRWLAPAAKARGCKVRSYEDPVAAGRYIKRQMRSKCLVLVKGSQNGVFAEEAVKPLLKNKSSRKQLVRQSPAWLNIKRKQFKLK